MFQYFFFNFFTAFEPISSITVSPDSALNATKAPPTAKPTRIVPKDMPMKSMKIDNASINSGETLDTAADNRYRRLVPYMTFYIPTNDFNFPVNHQLVKQFSLSSNWE